MEDTREDTRPTSGTRSKFLRTPPQNIDAERALLGALILKPEAMHDVSVTVYPESFFADKHREIYRAILDTFLQGDPIDILSITTKLKTRNLVERTGGAAYITELVETVPAASNAAYYAELVQNKSILRGLINAADEIAEIGYSDPENIDEAMDGAEKRIYQVTNAPTTQKFTPIGSSLTEAWDRFEKLSASDNEKRGVPSQSPCRFPKIRPHHSCRPTFHGKDHLCTRHRPQRSTSAQSIRRYLFTRDERPAVGRPHARCGSGC
jgi:replicative DNA helicase